MPQKQDIIIIGAGISGLHLANKLHSRNISFHLLEKKRQIGKDACTGIVSSRFTDYYPRHPSFFETELKGITIHTAAATTTLPLKTIVINHAAFDRYLAKQLPPETISTSKPVNSITFDQPTKTWSVSTNSARYQAKILIDASGITAISRPPRSTSNDRVLKGALSRLPKEDTPHENQKTSEIYFDPNYSSSHFAWHVPTKKETEYGVLTEKDPIKTLKRFMSDLSVQPKNILAHPIRITPLTSVFDGGIAIGEAAGQTKPLSGGGIIFALICGDIAADAITKSIQQNDTTLNFFKQHYERKWKSKLSASQSFQTQLIDAFLEIGIENFQIPDLPFSADYDFLF